MSSFGIKSPLRREIVTCDFYWSSASDLVELFHTNGFHTDNRIYKEIKVDELCNHVEPTPKPIPNNTKMHMIVFKPDGSIDIKRDLCDCEECIIGNVNNFSNINLSDTGKSNETDTNNNDDDIEIDDDDDDDSDVRVKIMCEIIQLGSVIALHTPPNVNKCFYLVVVNEKIVAEQDLFYAYQHYVLK